MKDSIIEGLVEYLRDWTLLIVVIVLIIGLMILLGRTLITEDNNKKSCFLKGGVYAIINDNFYCIEKPKIIESY